MELSYVTLEEFCYYMEFHYVVLWKSIILLKFCYITLLEFNYWQFVCQRRNADGVIDVEE